MNPIFRSTRTLLVVGLVAGSLAACSDSTDPTPAPLGTVTLVPELNMRAEDLSSDGKTVLMTDLSSATADFWFYDIATGTSTLKAVGRRSDVRLQHRRLERRAGQRHPRQA